MKTTRGIVLACAATLLMSACDATSTGREAAASCTSGVLKGDFTPINARSGDPIVSAAIAATARAVRSSKQTVLGEYTGYEGRTRGDGARCFQFVPNSCQVGGEVSLCITPSLATNDISASE